ncbi:putative disulfide formation protein C 1 [Frankliniella fusca]|uniref:Disulfide formation protein C 1 n=1 Tax=Frankliniella fusca TaxID=407009 RepID=A0AAE1H7F5_9NEOP|nr:putative disulfide formation protein C 1 [Frankliniella fusca]
MLRTVGGTAAVSQDNCRLSSERLGVLMRLDTCSLCWMRLRIAMFPIASTGFQT